MSSNKTLLVQAVPRVRVDSQLKVSTVRTPLTATAGCFSASVTANLLPISSEIFPHRVDYWSCSHVPYQQSCAVSITVSRSPVATVSRLHGGFTRGRFRKKIIKNSSGGLLSPFFHSLIGNTFGYNVIEPFSTVLFRTGYIVVLPTVGSKMTPCAKRLLKED